MSDIAARQQQNLLQQTPTPATETTLEDAQEPSKTLGLGVSARCISSMGIFFTFLTEQWKVQGGGAANHGLTNTCAATLRLPCVPRSGLGSLGAPRMPTNLLHHGSQNRFQKTSRNMAPERDLDCTSWCHMVVSPKTSRILWYSAEVDYNK